jgi:hypothetical protein
VKVSSLEGDGPGFESEVTSVTSAGVDVKHRRVRMNFENALKRVVTIQRKLGCDPRCPKNRLMRAVFNRITSRLRLAGHREELKFYACNGTCMDCLGVDCFFRCGNRIVTIDLYAGKYRTKKGGVRADLVLSRFHFLNNEHYQVADEIARRLLV